MQCPGPQNKMKESWMQRYMSEIPATWAMMKDPKFEVSMHNLVNVTELSGRLWVQFSILKIKQMKSKTRAGGKLSGRALA